LAQNFCYKERGLVNSNVVLKQGGIMEEILHPSKSESLKYIRGLIAKAMNSRNGHIYQPIITAHPCVICKSGVMGKSPEGLTCGEDICRDELARKVSELMDGESYTEQRAHELEEKKETIEDLIKEQEKQLVDLKKLKDKYEMLQARAKVACEVLKGLLPEGSADNPIFGVIMETISDLENA